jgi:hypothetical protein
LYVYFTSKRENSSVGNHNSGILSKVASHLGFSDNASNNVRMEEAGKVTWSSKKSEALKVKSFVENLRPETLVKIKGAGQQHEKSTTFFDKVVEAMGMGSLYPDNINQSSQQQPSFFTQAFQAFGFDNNSLFTQASTDDERGGDPLSSWINERINMGNDSNGEIHIIGLDCAFNGIFDPTSLENLEMSRKGVSSSFRGGGNKGDAVTHIKIEEIDDDEDAYNTNQKGNFSSNLQRTAAAVAGPHRNTIPTTDQMKKQEVYETTLKAFGTLLKEYRGNSENIKMFFAPLPVSGVYVDIYYEEGIHKIAINVKDFDYSLFPNSKHKTKEEFDTFVERENEKISLSLLFDGVTLIYVPFTIYSCKIDEKDTSKWEIDSKISKEERFYKIRKCLYTELVDYYNKTP